MPGFGLYFMLFILAACCDIEEKIYQVSISTMYLLYFMSKSGFCFGTIKMVSRIISYLYLVCVLVWEKKG